MNEWNELVETVVARKLVHPSVRALLVGLSGIDGSGKSYLAEQFAAALTQRGHKTALINLDSWHNLPEIRFDLQRPGENFYEKGLRLDEMFARLVLPLQDRRRARVTMDMVDAAATTSVPYTYKLEDVDIIVLEGVFLFRKAFRAHFDMAVWIDCSWETALERAIARGQEGLPPEETIRDFRTIYFSAQEIHFALDRPRASADIIISNDSRLNDRKAAGLNSSSVPDEK